jgi:hypothetical protein
MLSITAVLGPHAFGLRTCLGAQCGSQNSTGREVVAGGSAVLPTVSEGLENELSDFEAENATMKGDYLQQVVEIVIGDVPTVLEVPFMGLFMSHSRYLLQGSVSTNLFDPMKSISPAIAYGYTGLYFYLLNVEYLYGNMPSQSPHPDTTPVVRNVRSLANRQHQQNCGPSGKSQIPPAKRRVSVLAGERDSSQ